MNQTETAQHQAAIAAAKGRLSDLRSELKAAKDELAKVRDFIHARRELAETLGLELDSKSGGLANRAEATR